MAITSYCTPEWLEASQAVFRSDPGFQRALEKLSLTICFRVRAEPVWGIQRDILFGAVVERGVLLKMDFYKEEDARREADFIMAASPQEWKRILRKETKFLTDFMLGKIALEKGSKVAAVSLAPHAPVLVDALTRVELRFPDEMSPEELADYANYQQEFRARLGV